MENVETGNMFALETKLRGGNNAKQKTKLGNLAPTDYLTNTASRTVTPLERVRASHWRRKPVALTAPRGTAEMEYSSMSH